MDGRGWEDSKRDGDGNSPVWIAIDSYFTPLINFICMRSQYNISLHTVETPGRDPTRPEDDPERLAGLTRAGLQALSVDIDSSQPKPASTPHVPHSRLPAIICHRSPVSRPAQRPRPRSGAATTLLSPRHPSSTTSPNQPRRLTAITPQ